MKKANLGLTNLGNLSKLGFAWAAQPSAAPRRNAPLRASVAAASASAAKARVPSPPKARVPSPPKARVPSPPKARVPSPPKARRQTPSPVRRARARLAAGRFPSPNKSALKAWEKLSANEKRELRRHGVMGPRIAPTRFIQNLMNEEAERLERSRSRYSNNAKKNARLRASNLKRVRQIQKILSIIFTHVRSPTHLRRDPFTTRSPRSPRRSRARGRSLSTIREDQ
jgi:hypothetical protein